MFTGFRRYINAGNVKLLVGTIGVTTTAVALCSGTTKQKLGSFHNFCENSKENSCAASKIITAMPLMLPLDIWKSSLGKIVSVSHCHEAGDKCCKESAQPDSTPNPTTELNKRDMENRVVELSALSFDEAVLKNDKDVFVVFYAPWCGYCKRLCKSGSLARIAIALYTSSQY